jgi:hypothetical protein
MDVQDFFQDFFEAAQSRPQTAQANDAKTVLAKTSWLNLGGLASAAPVKAALSGSQN